MAQLQSIDDLKAYFEGVDYRANHHASNVNEIIYPLAGLVIQYMDANSKIKVFTRNGKPGNILWFIKNNKQFAFRYEHSNFTIEIRKNSYRGKLLHAVDNNTSIAQLITIFGGL